MKKWKKFASLLLAGIMTVTMAAPAFAVETETAKGEGNFTITLQNDKSGHKYEAYQIFAGDLLETTEDGNTIKVLSNIEWGSGVNTEGLIEAIKTDDNLKQEFGSLPENASAADVAKILEGKSYVGNIARAFADVIAKHLAEAAGTSSEVNDDAGKTTGYTISGLKAGYYLVKETTSSVGDGDAYSRYILQVVSDVTTKVKTEIPTVDKKIVEGEERVDANTAGVGAVVSYEITGAVPDYTGYEKYYYVINDKLSAGLTFNGDVEVKVGEKALTENEDYYLYTGEKANPYTFQVAFKNIKDYEKGTEITVTYSATVNADAVTGVSGNTNEVTLTYSNDPNSDKYGEKPEKPGTPDPTVPTGETPKEITVTYLTEIEIKKVDGNSDAPLAGAEFTLTGTSTQTVLKSHEYYELDEDGTYYLLKDGTYTETAPTLTEKDENGEVTVAGNEDKYVSITEKYAKKIATDTEVITVPVKMSATSDEEGKLVFKGLGEGTYTIEETVVPAGYNKADDQTVVITCTVPGTVADGNEKAEWSKGEGSSDGVTLGTNGNYLLTIANFAGSTLPETGGMGTTIFYVVGAVLILGAGVLLITRRRMRAE